MIEHALRAHEEAVGPAVVYCHPWELDPEARTLPGTPRYVRLWKRLGRTRTLPALQRLLADVHVPLDPRGVFGRADVVVERADGAI